MLWFALRGDPDRGAALRAVAVGADSARVHAALGAPARDCPTGSLEHLRRHMPEDTPPALLEGTLEDLRRRTARRWVYPQEGEAPSCTAGAEATEIGLDREGRVLWYVPVTGKTPVELPVVEAAGTP